MKKLLLLVPVILGASLLGGCVEDEAYYDHRPAYYGGYVEPRVAVYDDPYYDYDGVYYYYSGGRYYRLRDGRRIYVDVLPYGGRYLRHRDRDDGRYIAESRFHEDRDWREKEKYKPRDRDGDNDRERNYVPYAEHKSKPHHEDSNQEQHYSGHGKTPPQSATAQGPLPRYQTQSKPESGDHDGDKKKKKHKDDD